MKKLLGLFTAAVLALGLTACGNDTAKQPEAPSADQEAASAEAQVTQGTEQDPIDLEFSVMTDRAGNEITLPETVESVISLAPATTQILCEIGLADKIVAVDSNSPMYTSDLPEGTEQFNLLEPDLERIISMNPDIVFASSMSSQGGDDIFKAVKDAGICVAEIPTSNSIADVEEDVRFTAACVGKSAEGEALIEAMEKDIQAVKEIGASIEEKKTVLFEISPLPYLYSFGSGVYLNEMLELIGAQNVLADQDGWISVTEESAVASNPDVILTSDNFSNNDPVAEILGRAGWENVTAVSSEQVYYIDNAASSLPNHHITDALKEMAKAVYPEEFAQLQ